MFSSGLMWTNYPLIKIKNKYVLFHKVREKENIPMKLPPLVINGKKIMNQFNKNFESINWWASHLERTYYRNWK